MFAYQLAVNGSLDAHQPEVAQLAAQFLSVLKDQLLQAQQHQQDALAAQQQQATALHQQQWMRAQQLQQQQSQWQQQQLRGTASQPATFQVQLDTVLGTNGGMDANQPASVQASSTPKRPAEETTEDLRKDGEALDVDADGNEE